MLLPFTDKKNVPNIWAWTLWHICFKQNNLLIIKLSVSFITLKAVKQSKIVL